MKKFQEWLKENTVALDGSTVNTPTGTDKNPEQIFAGKWNEVGIASPVGTPKQLTGTTEPTGEISHLPSISLDSIKTELAKPGLQEAIAALSPTLSEALIGLLEDINMGGTTSYSTSGTGSLKNSIKTSTHTMSTSPSNKNVQINKPAGESSLSKGTNTNFTYNKSQNKTYVKHVDGDTHHETVLQGHFSRHFE